MRPKREGPRQGKARVQSTPRRAPEELALRNSAFEARVASANSAAANTNRSPSIKLL